MAPKKAGRKIRTENCMEPAEGPKRMASAIEKLIPLIVKIANQNDVPTDEQADLFDELCKAMSLEKARGADFGLGILRATENLKLAHFSLRETKTLDDKRPRKLHLRH